MVVISKCLSIVTICSRIVNIITLSTVSTYLKSVEGPRTGIDSRIDITHGCFVC
jgi:hypothetical protein